MTDRADAAFLHLLVSHICHELVSPIGAIGNGVELMEELGTLDPDALGLVQQSNRTAAAKLRLLRLVYGSAGMSTAFHLPDARQSLVDLFAIEAKHMLDWRAAPGVEVAPGGVQLVTAAVLLAVACLPRGGAIAMALDRAASGAALAVKATGVGARLTDELRLALAGQGEPDHKTIHAHFCAWSAANLGCAMTAAATDDGILISALLPFAAEG